MAVLASPLQKARVSQAKIQNKINEIRVLLLEICILHEASSTVDLTHNEAAIFTTREAPQTGPLESI